MTPMTTFSKATRILSKEGLSSLFKQGFSYFWNSLLSHGEYFIIEFRYRDQPEIPIVKPKIACTYRAITSLSEFHEVLAQGYNFGSRKFPPRLKKGAVAFCTFVDKVLASESWAAADKRAKNAVDTIPYRVDFAKGEVCVGASFTDSRYRGNKLNEYLNFMRTPYLKEHFTRGWASTNVNNKASMRINEMIFGKVTARGRYFRFAGWRYWKEKTVVS
jgi:hypothetical protein